MYMYISHTAYKQLQNICAMYLVTLRTQSNVWSIITKLTTEHYVLFLVIYFLSRGINLPVTVISFFRLINFLGKIFVLNNFHTDQIERK